MEREKLENSLAEASEQLTVLKQENERLNEEIKDVSEKWKSATQELQNAV